jgi:DNA-binding NarL/FixJ family response regulator
MFAIPRRGIGGPGLIGRRSQRRRRPQARVRGVDLTPREREVALLVERNLSNDEIARELCIKPGTVKIHVHHILVKLGARDGVRRTGRSSKGATTAAGREQIRETQQRRWQRWRTARSRDNT